MVRLRPGSSATPEPGSPSNSKLPSDTRPRTLKAKDRQTWPFIGNSLPLQHLSKTNQRTAQKPSSPAPETRHRHSPGSPGPRALISLKSITAPCSPPAMLPDVFTEQRAPHLQDGKQLIGMPGMTLHDKSCATKIRLHSEPAMFFNRGLQNDIHVAVSCTHEKRSVCCARRLTDLLLVFVFKEFELGQVSRLLQLAVKETSALVRWSKHDRNVISGISDHDSLAIVGVRT